MSVLLGELADLKQQTNDRATQDDIDLIEKYAARLYNKLVDKVPREYAVNRAADLGIKSSRMALEKLAYLLEKELG